MFSDSERVIGSSGVRLGELKAVNNVLIRAAGLAKLCEPASEYLPSRWIGLFVILIPKGD